MTKPWSRKPMTPLMLDLLRWYASRLKGATPIQQNYRIRTGTFIGLIDRGLLAPYATYAVEDDFTIGGHALTTAGLKQALTYVSDTATRRAIARQLLLDAAHCLALAEGIDHYDARVQLIDEADTARYAALSAGTPLPFGLTQGRRPEPEPSADQCGIHSAMEYGQIYGDRCALDRGHAGNHSWAPKDLAPSPLKVQREALAADQAHAKRASKVRDDQAAGSVTPAADPGWVADRDEAGRMTSEEADAYYGATETTAPLEHERSLVEVRAELNEPTPHQQYGADERWTHLGGAKFRLGPDTDPVVTAHAVRDMHGWFMLHILGHVFGPVERGEGGTWHEVRGR